MSRLKKGLALVLTLCMMLSLMPVITPSAAALTMGTKPEDGTTTGNPFKQGTGGSNSFRIPAMVTLNDGTIVAAADARWNTTYDGGGLDTVVSYSKDNGANWNYTFANYLGDNGNEYNGKESTAFIDPCLTTDGSTVYMLCDLYPYGVALNGSDNTAPSTAVGFNDDGTLKLACKDTPAVYDYYLKDGQIYDSSNSVVSGYTVDAYFNITGTDGTSSNLFFSDSPFKVVRTGYLYLTKSTDGGKNWSEPTLIPNVKTSSEQVCLVGPGRGLVTSDGKIIFPVYSYNGSSSSQQMGFIYSTDGGTTWFRSANFTGANWSSESAVVELTDGTLRFFYRNGTSALCYADYTWGTGWSSAVNTGIATNSNTQISAISYSKTVDGKQVILVSCPTGSGSSGSANSSASARLNGKIFVGLVDSGDEKKMSWQSDKAISVTSNDSQFMYSCLTELNNGKVAILYEDYENAWGTKGVNGQSEDCYYTMSYATYDLNLTFDAGTGETGGGSNSDLKQEPITLTAGGTAEKNITGANYAGEYETKNPSIATVTVTGNNGQVGGVTYKEATVTCNTLIGSNSSSWTAVSGYYYKADDGSYYPVYAQRSWSYVLGTGWTCTFTWGYSTTGSASNVTPIDTQSTTNTSDAPNITVYTQSTAEAVDASTTITFYGVSAGETSVVVGDTQYNITVNRKAQSVNLTAGSSVSYADAGTTIESNTNNSVASATLSGSTLTIKGLKNGTTTITTNTTVYTVTVADRGGAQDAFTIAVSEDKTISVALNDGEYVEWSVDDASIAGVAGVLNTEDNTYGADGMVVGRAEGTTTVTGTVKNAAGETVAVYTWEVTVTAKTTNGSGSRTVYVNIDLIEHCTVYYSINGGELIKVNGTGVVVNKTVSAPDLFNIMLFAAPDEGYALTYIGYMYSTQSKPGNSSQFYTLSDGNLDGTGSEAWPFANADYSGEVPASGSGEWKSNHGFKWALIEGNMSINQMKVLFSNAIALGCDGVTTITVNNTNNGTYNYSNFYFVAQRLPKVEKEISTINGKSYTDGMKVELGDTIEYTITVTKYKAYGNVKKSYPEPANNNATTTESAGTITFTNDQLIDELTGSNFSPSYTSLGSTTSEDKTYTYTTSLKLTMDNFADVVKDGKITNTAELSYSYSSEYSTGTLTAASSAVADITVSVPEYVIDFGLPVSIDLTGVAGNATISGGSAAYGTIAPNGQSFTYTPNRVIKGMDHVTVRFTNGQSYGVNIYPATTVYYEEGFAALTGFTSGSKGTGNQATWIAGKSTDEYGYDKKYADESYGPSNNTQATSKAKGDKAVFEFTGTGVDIYTNSTEATGWLMIRVKNAEGTTVNLLQVNTALLNGTTNATIGQEGTGYNIPVASITGLDHGTYTVTISNLDNVTVNLDGFRVYGTLEDQSNKVYQDDLEDNPTFIELRDEVLTAKGVKVDSSQYASQAAGQVYKESNVTSAGAIILSDTQNGFSETELLDLLDNGPKNEIYLQPGQALTFNVTTPREVQIGLKALNASVNCTINDTSKTITTSTDMFYTVANQNVATSGITVTITNKDDSSGILAVTKLKICDDPNAALGTLTADDLIPALISLGFKAPEGEEDSSGTGTPAEPDTGTPDTPADPGTGLPFTDVGTGDWFLENVKYVYEKGLMNGTSDTTFSPKKTTNRAMIVTILHRLEGTPAPETQSPFTDVPADQYYAEAVAWAAANGIVNGTSDTTFAPLNNITREQMAAILYRYAQYKGYDVSGSADLSGFTDAASISDYAVSALQWAVDAGLINGKGNGILDPKGSATRAEVSAILSRFCENIAG